MLTVLAGDYRKLLGAKSCERTRRGAQMESAGEYRCNTYGFHLVCVFPASAVHDRSNKYQDLDSFCYGIVDLPLLYFAGGREVIRV